VRKVRGMVLISNDYKSQKQIVILDQNKISYKRIEHPLDFLIPMVQIATLLLTS